MRLLLDECVPRPLRRDIAGHDVVHVCDLDWSGKRNGELLSALQQAGFAALLTVDQNLPFQQNLLASGISVLILIVRTNRRKDLQPLVPGVLAALQDLRPGQLVRVGA